MDFVDWINGKSIQSKRFIQENIFELNVDGKKYILKRIDRLSEYLIQKDLVSLELPIFQKKIKLLYSFEPLEEILDIKTLQEIDNQRREDKFYILMRKIKGYTLKKVIDQLTVDDLESIVQIVFWSLKICWDKLEFVHLDLHLNNIMVRKLTNPVIVLLDTKETLLEIKTHWLPFIIDFEESITKKYPNEMVKMKKTVLQDIWRFLGTLSLFVKKQDQYQVLLNYLSYFIDPMKFQENKELYAKQGFQILP